MANTRREVASVSGVATFDDGNSVGPVTQITVIPTSASGTGTVTVKPVDTTDATAAYEALYDSAKAAMTIDLSAQNTVVVQGPELSGVKVTSSNSADTFSLVVSG